MFNAPDPTAVMLEFGPLSLAGRSSALPGTFRFPGAKIDIFSETSKHFRLNLVKKLAGIKYTSYLCSRKQSSVAGWRVENKRV